MAILISNNKGSFCLCLTEGMNMKKNIKRTCKSESVTEKILIMAAKQSHVPSKYVNQFVKESAEQYEKAAETIGGRFSTFEFRKLF